MKKKGISPIIASILLIVFVLVISVVVVSWMRGSVEKQIESGEERSEEMVTGLRTGVKILDAKPIAGKLRLTITNTGKNTISKVNIKVEGEDGIKVTDEDVNIGSLDSATIYVDADVGRINNIEVTPVVDEKLIGLAKTKKTIKITKDEDDTSEEGLGIYVSCKKLKEKDPNLPNDIYTINPGNEAFEVYCDMTSDGGGWSLVASYKGNSYGWAQESSCHSITGGNCDSSSEKQQADNLRQTMRNRYKTTDTFNSLSDLGQKDIILKSYSTVSFSEQMFKSPDDKYIIYEISADSVADFYGSSSADYTNEYSPSKTNVDVSVNKCNDLKIRFIGEDSDSGYYISWHAFNAGPNWKSKSNNNCPYDDVASHWKYRKLGGQNVATSSHIMWFVR